MGFASRKVRSEASELSKGNYQTVRFGDRLDRRRAGKGSRPSPERREVVGEGAVNRPEWTEVRFRGKAPFQPLTSGDGSQNRSENHNG